MALALDRIIAGVSGWMWIVVLSLSHASLYFLCEWREKNISPKFGTDLSNSCSMLTFSCSGTFCYSTVEYYCNKCNGCNIYYIQIRPAYITEDISILFGQKNGRQVHWTGEWKCAWMLFVQFIIEDLLGFLYFNNIKRTLWHPSTSTEPLQVSLIYSLGRSLKLGQL